MTRAAERLHITQSTASGMLSRLRDHFDDPLLVAVGRTMKLTPLAESLVGPVRDINLRINSVLNAAPVFDPLTVRRHFVILASDYVGRVFLSEVLRRTVQLAPGLSFDIRSSYPEMMQEFEQGRVDFIVSPAHLANSGHPSAELFEDDYRIVACAKNAELDQGVSLNTYMALGHVLYQDESLTNPWFEQWYVNQFGRTRRIEVITYNYNLMPAFLVGTQRIATVHTRLAKLFDQSIDVRLHELPMPSPKLTLILQWHQVRDEDPGIVWLRHQMLEVARAMPSLA